MSKITINNNSIFSDMAVLYYCAKDATTDQHGAEREKWERKKKKDLMIKMQSGKSGSEKRKKT